MPTLDEPGRTLDHPRKPLDLVQAYKLRVVNRLSYAEIAKALNVPKSTVHAALHRLTALVPDPEAVQAFEEVEVSILTSAKEKLLASLVDPDAIQKASLNNRAYAFSQVATHERLLKNKSTVNVGIWAQVIQGAKNSLMTELREGA